MESAFKSAINPHVAVFLSRFYRSQDYGEGYRLRETFNGFSSRSVSEDFQCMEASLAADTFS
jgi:hypothetical protein